MVPRRDLRREVVQGARHPRSVRVGQSDHAIAPARPEFLHALVRADPVRDAPGVIVEPAPDGLRQPIGKEMHVRVDVKCRSRAGSRRWSGCATTDLTLPSRWPARPARRGPDRLRSGGAAPPRANLQARRRGEESTEPRLFDLRLASRAAPSAPGPRFDGAEIDSRNFSSSSRYATSSCSSAVTVIGNSPACWAQRARCARSRSSAEVCIALAGPVGARHWSSPASRRVACQTGEFISAVRGRALRAISARTSACSAAPEIPPRPPVRFELHGSRARARGRRARRGGKRSACSLREAWRPRGR